MGRSSKITHHGVARTIDRNVDPAELLRGLLDSRFRLNFVGKVQLDECEVLARHVAQQSTGLTAMTVVVAKQS